MSIRPFLIAGLVALGATTVGKVARAEGPVIGYVNLQRAILEVEEGKRAKTNLSKAFEKKQSELSKREEALKGMKDALDRESVVKNDAQTQAKRAEFQAKLMELQQVFMKEQKELQEMEQKELSGITDRMRIVINDIGKAGGYTLILETSENRLLFAKPHLDLTNEVIRKFNTKHK